MARAAVAITAPRAAVSLLLVVRMVIPFGSVCRGLDRVTSPPADHLPFGGYWPCFSARRGRWWVVAWKRAEPLAVRRLWARWGRTGRSSSRPSSGECRRPRWSALLLDQERLITLTGPGGCGKTRLAQRAASSRAEAFGGRLFWSDLTPLADGIAVAETVRAAVGAFEQPGRTPLESAIAKLGSASAVLVLDNCEHVLVDACEIATALLSCCTGLVVLATSREPLGVEGELVWRVPPLAVPSATDSLAAEALDAYDAVWLFADRARHARHDFTLSAANAEAVAELVRRLDGMPLAIELAAARVSALLPAQILAGLDDRFSVLSKAPRGVTTRHRSLEASVAWSYDLLTEFEQVALRRLGVFAGSFTRDAVLCVITGEDLPADDGVRAARPSCRQVPGPGRQPVHVRGPLLAADRRSRPSLSTSWPRRTKSPRRGRSTSTGSSPSPVRLTWGSPAGARPNGSIASKWS